MIVKHKGLNQKDRIIHLFEIFYTKNLSEIEIDELSFLIELVEIFRPKQIDRFNEISLSPLKEVLETYPEYLDFFTTYIYKLLIKRDFDIILTDVGIIKDSDFIYELRKRVVEKFLPNQPKKHTLQFILNQVFHKSSDPAWIKKIPVSEIQGIMNLIQARTIYKSEINQHFEISEILYSMEILALRISGRVLETDVNRMVPEYQNLDSPFIAFQRELSELNELIFNSEKKYVTPDNLIYKQLLILHNQCVEYIDTAFNNSHKFGISMHVNQSLLRIRQQLQRLKEVLQFCVLDSKDSDQKRTIELAILLIQYNCGKANISNLIKESTQSVSYEITQHAAKTGEHYITNTKSEYYRMLRAASGGGLIVGFLCVFKVLLSKLDASEFGFAFLYSMNYAMGFIAIYLFGFTLATKQPAMTASALAKALEAGNKNRDISNDDKYEIFARLFSRVFRSQFIAFVGNVFLAFPVALILIWLIDLIFSTNITEGSSTALLDDLNPNKTPAVYHAAIAGFFLFASGLIEGAVNNRNKFNHIYFRIQEHPLLKRVLGRSGTQRISNYYESKGAGITSNFWFGVFMGSTASIGLFLGLNLDIRHITFASGNLALGLYGGNFDIPTSVIVWGIFGIGIIGFVNFIVSFSLSLTLALRSRNISFLELRYIVQSIWKYFRKNPISFFLPKAG